MKRSLCTALLACGLVGGTAAPALSSHVANPTFTVLGPVKVDRGPDGPVPMPTADVRVRFSCPVGQVVETYAALFLSFGQNTAGQAFRRTGEVQLDCTGKVQVETLRLPAFYGRIPAAVRTLNAELHIGSPQAGCMKACGSLPPAQRIPVRVIVKP